MGFHPVNLGLRFLLELCALAAVGLFGWTRFSGALQWVSCVAFPLVFMALWGTFAVPEDPSRSGGAPVPIPGVLRLCLELALF
ncbi:MAG: YrdB family protein, partial [Nannocystaceae bacterium]